MRQTKAKRGKVMRGLISPVQELERAMGIHRKAVREE